MPLFLFEPDRQIAFRAFAGLTLCVITYLAQ